MILYGKKIILLRSSDGEIFGVEEAVAAQSLLINEMIEGGRADDVIPLPKITGKILTMVIDYCNRHADNLDTDFVNVDQVTLLDLNLAADYLNIKSLMYLTSQTLTPPPLDPIPFGGLVEKWLPDSLDSPFRNNVRRFLRQCADRKDYDIEGMPVWVSTLVDKKRGGYLPLYIVEEDVKLSAEPFCKYCAPAGWGGHFLTKMNYHFIIPMSDEWNNPLDEGTFDLDTHLLHGLIHGDGYGHLVCINGIEGGSDFITGSQVMDFWEFICQSLRVRQISVCDLSRKNGMDLRLLYGVSCGGSWFGRWGYRFRRGTFGSTEEDYRKALDNLSSLGLEKGGTSMSQIIRFYTNLSKRMGGDKLSNVRDLLGFMVSLKLNSKDPTVSRIKEVRYKKYSDIVQCIYSGWTRPQLEDAGWVIVRCLEERRSRIEGSNGRMTRQEILDKLGLRFDCEEKWSYALKLMNNVVVELENKRKYLVRRGVNGVTRMQEYTIHDYKEGCLPAKPAHIGQCVDHDIRCLYENLLCGESSSDPIENSVEIILKSKHFVKEFSLGEDNMLRFNCLVSSRDQVFRGISVGEFTGATIDDIKVAVESEMRDAYCIADNVEVLDVEEGLCGSRREVWLNCRGLDIDSKLRFQGEDKKVICFCGAREDDGEWLVSCYPCGAWWHVRCVGYKPFLGMAFITCCPPPFQGCQYVD